MQKLRLSVTVIYNLLLYFCHILTQWRGYNFVCEADHSESYNSLYLYFTNIWGTRPNSVRYDCFLECTCSTRGKIGRINWLQHFLKLDYLPLIRKWISLVAYMKVGLTLGPETSFENVDYFLKLLLKTQIILVIDHHTLFCEYLKLFLHPTFTLYHSNLYGKVQVFLVA